MTLQPTPITPVPEETARVAHAAFPKRESLHADAGYSRSPLP